MLRCPVTICLALKALLSHSDDEAGMTSTLRATSDSRGYCTCCSPHHLSGSNYATFGIGICSYGLISSNSRSVNGTSTLEPLAVVEHDWLPAECNKNSSGDEIANVNFFYNIAHVEASAYAH